jgi:hypothetical protein
MKASAEATRKRNVVAILMLDGGIGAIKSMIGQIKIK